MVVHSDGNALLCQADPHVRVSGSGSGTSTKTLVMRMIVIMFSGWLGVDCSAKILWRAFSFSLTLIEKRRKLQNKSINTNCDSLETGGLWWLPSVSPDLSPFCSGMEMTASPGFRLSQGVCEIMFTRHPACWWHSPENACPLRNYYFTWVPSIVGWQRTTLVMRNTSFSLKFELFSSAECTGWGIWPPSPRFLLYPSKHPL